ncbi:GNAT family N-acetyltransferase [Alicyclobacillus sp. SO9]|uniref:GNAT family N-acetyltransferase n=1 Tax=Alicyclobacillus sp. SO9 TaxID=2665646 RepID=UPI0018E8ECE5|nr:GNAT family N-acetyltransferase [Alicyclobacillus sp. SO9]QQE79941.1 GNAT family N-acetyltransferase [Alicyclobacillus sp. SO9]
MDWYEKLTDYFPEHELKDVNQMEALLEHVPAYRKRETEDYLVMYAEYPDFIFLDYLLVYPGTRGRGIGGQVIGDFQSKGKLLIAEVEPEDEENADTGKRIRFYEKNGFRLASNIEYTRWDNDGEVFRMDIYYWSPDPTHERQVLQMMKHICREIHNFQAMKYYGRLVANPETSLQWKH